MRRKLLACLILLSAGISVFAAESKPNVVFILADDLGWADTTLFGKTKYYRTPNLERLAKRGMTFNRAYSASPLCSPTRSAILTGLSPARTGITSPSCHSPNVVLQATPGKAAPADQKAIGPSVVTRLKTEYRTLAEALKEEGYATGHFGKWHLGAEPYSPLQHGFDVDVPHWPGPGPAGGYVAPWKFRDFDADPGEPNQHIEDRMAKEAAAFMEKHRDEPFYLNYWMFSVHAPFDAKKALIEKYVKTSDANDPQRCPTYAAMVESMDDAIGTLLDTLDRLKLSERTIIVFTSDNGGNMYNVVDGEAPTSNAPLRGGKATMFEGGTRVPGIVVMPGVTPAGSRSEAIVQSEDYYPTLLEALALKPAPGQRFDGSSIMAALKGDALRGKAVFQYFPHDPAVPDWLPPAVSVHRDDWKLIRIFYGGEKGAHRYFLFNLREDLGEKTNLAAQQPGPVAELDGLIEKFLVETKAVQPIPNPAFNPAKYHPEREGLQKSKAAREARAKTAGRPPSGKAAEDPSWQGWKPRGCKARVEDGSLRVTNMGEDSFLGFAAGNHNGASAVTFSDPRAARLLASGLAARGGSGGTTSALHPAGRRLGGSERSRARRGAAGYRAPLSAAAGRGGRHRMDPDKIGQRKQDHAHRFLTGKQPRRLGLLSSNICTSLS
jgi:arylsulfatase A-like enzyme